MQELEMFTGSEGHLQSREFALFGLGKMLEALAVGQGNRHQPMLPGISIDSRPRGNVAGTDLLGCSFTSTWVGYNH